MSTEAANLPNDVETLQAMVTEQSSTIASLTTKLAKLEHYLEQLVRARYGPRSEQLDPGQLTLFDTTATDEKHSVQPPQHAVRVKGKRPRNDTSELGCYFATGVQRDQSRRASG